MKKIVILDGYVANPGDLSWDKLKEFGELTVFDNTKHDEIIERAKDAFAIFTNKVIIDLDTMKQLPNLKFIGVLATGYNNVDIDGAKSLGITVCNVPKYSTHSVVQLVFAHLLNIVDQVHLHTESVIHGEWSRCPNFSYRLAEMIELNGLTMGIYGLGNIGMEVARIANAFGMRVISFTTKEQSQLPDYITKVTKKEMFQQSDVLSLNAPLTKENHHFVNTTTLKWMKPSAIVINTARGGLVDERALSKALNEGHLFAAGLDVLDVEPPIPENLLINARNCYVTPHIAWQSDKARTNLLEITYQNLKAFVEDNPQNVVE